MLSVKNKNNENEKDFNKNINKELENKENENNQKMNYIYSAQVVEELKQNCDELEKLEKEYIKRIEEGKQDKENKRPRVFSAIKTGNKRYKLNNEKEKKRGETNEKK